MQTNEAIVHASMDQIWANARETVRSMRPAMELFCNTYDPERGGEHLRRFADSSLACIGYLATVAIAEVLHRLDQAEALES